MRPMAPACLAAFAVLTGCGSSTGAPARTTATMPAQQAAPAPKLGPVTVSRPRTGRILHAHAVGSELVATLHVSGHADPRQMVYTQASCTRPSCERLAPSDARGRFSAQSVIVAPIGEPDVRVNVGYTDPASGREPLVLTVTLRPPGSHPRAARPTPAPTAIRRRHRRRHRRPCPPRATPVAPLPPIPAPTATVRGPAAPAATVPAHRRPAPRDR